MPDSIKKNMEIIAVKNVDEVLKIALTKNLKRVEWVEVEQLPKNKLKKSQKHQLIKHLYQAYCF